MTDITKVDKFESANWSDLEKFREMLKNFSVCKFDMSNSVLERMCTYYVTGEEFNSTTYIYYMMLNTVVLVIIRNLIISNLQILYMILYIYSVRKWRN